MRLDGGEKALGAGGSKRAPPPPPRGGVGDMLFAPVTLTAWRRARWCRERAVES